MNPFIDWKPEQQCRFEAAIDMNGREVKIEAPEAVQWCAIGWLELRGFDFAKRWPFRQFVSKHYNDSIITLNDNKRWTPSQFAAAWDECERERES